MIADVQSEMPRVMSRWPEANLTRYGDSVWSQGLLTVPDVVLPEGWSPHVVTLLIPIPAGFPGATPGDHFDTKEHVYVLNQQPHRSWETDDGTRFAWRVQMWNPNHDGLHTLVRVCIRRFGNAKGEVQMKADLNRTLKQATEDWVAAYAAYDRKRGRQ